MYKKRRENGADGGMKSDKSKKSRFYEKFCQRA